MCVCVCVCVCVCIHIYTEVYLEPSRTPTVELFAKIVND